MQSGYGGGGGGGGVSDLQQFLVPDGSAVFSLSTNPTPPSSAAAAPLSSHPFINYHHHHHHHHNPLLHHLHHQPPHPPPPLQPLLTPFGMPFLPIPVPPPPPPPPPAAAATQQLFYQEHDFRLFHTHSPSPPPPLPPENHSGGSDDTGPSLLSAAAVNFKLAVDSSGGGGGPEEESTIKELSWRPLDIDFLHNSNSSNNKRHKSGSCDRHDEPDPEPSSKYGEKRSGNADNYKIFSELEAIYKPGSSSAATTPTAAAAAAANQTGSGSALTGDDYPIIAAAAENEAPDDVGGTSETSAGEEAAAAARNCQRTAGIAVARNKERRRQRRQRRKQQQLQAMVGFMEATVKRLMDHQESLHRSFLEAAERRDRERTRSDESWREQAAARSSQEAAAAATAPVADSATPPGSRSLENVSETRIHLLEEVNNKITLRRSNGGAADTAPSRWPRAEVRRMIGGAERAGGEVPGARAERARSLKRCKEKWRTSNKYFRNAKGEQEERGTQQHQNLPLNFTTLDDPAYSSRFRALPTHRDKEPRRRINANSGLARSRVVSKITSDSNSAAAIGIRREDEEGE
ncbi:YLP motif-containing protein 1-like [Ananas comosus]|uniref:YLP motif-containing protein 1-like n=1 Tax=Ananas comosus TaxID=4615 RepID=A0A6P5EEF8_ANACO|nr:YLP motif-containing protein 1-like [Ananas comosus]